MRKLILPLALSLIAVCGCVRRYVITLNNGSQIATHSKPRLKGNVYVFKDALGRETSKSAGSIREIAPASMAKIEKAPFNPGPLR